MDSRTKSIQDILGLMQKNLECSICLDLLTNPVSTKCDHPFCRFCITEFLKTKTSVPCPLCKCPITKRSLNDRPQLSHIVENVRLLLGAFSKDTGHKYSPPRAPSADLLSSTPEQLPRKEAKGTKRKITVNERKGTSGRNNVRQSKRRKSDITPEVTESTIEVTETDDLNKTTDGVETDQPNINTALGRVHIKSNVNQEESKTDQILCYLRSGSGGALVSDKGDPAFTNFNTDLTKRNTELVDSNLKSRTRSTPHVSELVKSEECGKTTENFNSERHLRHKNRKNYKEDSEEFEICDDVEGQGYSESQGHSELSSLPESTPHVATVTRTYDKQFVNRKNVRGVSKVKEWLTSNHGHGKGQGHMQESGDVMNKGSLEQPHTCSLEDDFEHSVEDGIEEDYEVVSCDSSIPETAQSVDNKHADASDKNPLHSETATVSLSLSSENVPQTCKPQSTRGEKGGQVPHKIFKTTRNNQHMETSVKQTKGKFLFKKIQPKSVLGIDQGKGVEPLKSKEPSTVTHKESFKLRELDVNTFGNDSDPYEFKSSQVTPVKPKVQRRKAKEDKRKEGQISVEIQSMLGKKSGKSILKKASGDHVEVSEAMKRGGGEGAGDGKKKKLSPKALQRQKDEEEALREMRDKISQAEDYDLVTCTQEVLEHMTEEENGTKGGDDDSSKNKKIVSFNQDVIFISSQNQSGVKTLKGVSESPKNVNALSNNIEKCFNGEDGTASTKTGNEQRTEGVLNGESALKACHSVYGIGDSKMQEISENLTGEISENVLSSKGNKGGNLTFTSLEDGDNITVTSLEDDDDDDGNSSSTTDLDIQPEESEFAVPNLDIQPIEILEKLSSQDFTPNNFVTEKNTTENCGTIEEMEIVPISEDLGQGRNVPKYSRRSGKQKITKVKVSINNHNEEGSKSNIDINLNKGKRGEKYKLLDFEKSPVLSDLDRGKESYGDRNCLKTDVSSGRAEINSVKVVPETPLIAIDSEISVVDANYNHQEKNILRKSRLKKSNKEQTCKKRSIAARCEETHRNKDDAISSSERPTTKSKEMSENVIPPSVDMVVTDTVALKHQSEKEDSESIPTHLSSETQDRQASHGSKLKGSESTSTQLSSESQNSQSCAVRKLRTSSKKLASSKAASLVVPETPVLGEAKITEEEVTELPREQNQNTSTVSDSQQSLSSLCSTQESVSILAPVHKTFEKTAERNLPACSREKLNSKSLDNFSKVKKEGQAQNLCTKDIVEIKSQENEVDSLDKSSSCEIITERDSPIDMITEGNKLLNNSSSKLRRTKRKCFSLTSHEGGPGKELQAKINLSRTDDEDIGKQKNNNKVDNVKTGKCEEVLEVMDDVEKKKKILENHSEVGSSGDIKRTPSDALIPTQLSLKSIKKREMKLKKQQQSSPEDVFLMDSETPGSGSSYQDLVQNQEGLLELEFGDLDSVCEMDAGDSQVKSSSGRMSEKVQNTDHVEISSIVKDYSQGKKEEVEYMQCEDSRNGGPVVESESKNSESRTVTTIPDTDDNVEEFVDQNRSDLKSARAVYVDSNVSQMDKKMTENCDSLRNSESQKNCRSSGSDVSNAGRRAVRGLARKLRQKNVHDTCVVSDECEKVKTLSDSVDCNRKQSKTSRENRNIESKGENYEDQLVAEPVCYNVVPETVELGVEDFGQMDDEVTAIPETVEDSLPGEEEECDAKKETKRAEDESENEDIEDKKATCIQEKLKQDDEKRNEKCAEKSLFSVKEDFLKMDDTQEREVSKVNLYDVEFRPAQTFSLDDGNGGTVGELGTVTKKASYMETAADDEPLFNSPESSPLPDILEEEEYEKQQENPSEYTIKSSRGALPQEKEDLNDSDSSDLVLLPEDKIPPEDTIHILDTGPQNAEDHNSGYSSKAAVDFVKVWEGKIPSYELGTKSKRMVAKVKKGCEEDEMKNFVDLSDDEDDSDNDELIHRRKPIKKALISDDDDSDEDDDDEGDDNEEEESIGRKKKKTAVIISDDEEESDVTEHRKSKTSIISDDEEENDVTEHRKSKDSVISDDEDDSDFSQESLTSRQMNLTSSSAFSSQSEGYNTQNQVLLRQELERMKKEMAEIESRISKGNQNKDLRVKKSPSPTPSQETVEEPYSEYLRELQGEASEGDSPEQSQKTMSKMADEIEACHSDDSSDLFLSPAPPSPPPSDPHPPSAVEIELSENFKETEKCLQEFRNDEKTSEGKLISEQNGDERLQTESEMKGGSDDEVENGEDYGNERGCLNHSSETSDPSEIAESPQKSKNTPPCQSSLRDNFPSNKDPLVIQESPQSQKPSKNSVDILKDLYHSTPVSSNKKPQGGRKNTLSFMSPIVTPREILGTSQIETYTGTREKVQSPLVHKSPRVENQNKVFIASGLPLNQLNELRRLVQSQDCKFHPKFSPYTTHLIVKTVPPGSRVCERTLKFFQALAYKCWILDYQWVTDSIAAGRLLEEGSYEITGDTVTNANHYGPRKSRTQSPTDPGILNGIQFHIIGSSQGLNPDDIRDLIETCGGSVVKDPEEFDDDYLCLIITCAALEDSQETAPSQEIILFNRLYRKYRAVTVSREWLLDSLTVYDLQPLNDYVLTSVKGMVIPSV